MRCAVYIRVSTDKEEQATSLENQQRLFIHYMGQQGWGLFDFYIDVESGTTANRENFQRMIEDAEKKKFDCILAKELSRLARNGELAYKLKRILRSSSVHFITLDGAINTLEDNTDKFGLYAWLYEEESQRISKRIKVALVQKAKAGEFKGSNPPYGYKVVNKQLVVGDTSTVETVKAIFRLYLQGKGIESIAKEMDKRKYPTPATIAQKKNAGQFWHGTTVKLILQNPHYVGDLVQCRSQTRSAIDKTRELISENEWIVVQNAHEAIISREDFEAVKTIMKSRYYKRPKAKRHLFTNIVYCADCGTSLWYLHDRKGYVCGRYRKHGINGCTSHLIREKQLKNVILEDLREMSSVAVNKSDFVQKASEKVKSIENDFRKREQKISNEIELLKTENKNLLRLLAQGTIEQEDYRQVADENNLKVQDLQQKLVILKKQLNDRNDHNQLTAKLMKYVDRILEFNELNEELLHRIIERIEVKENQEFVIHYRFTNPNAI
ncbi:recombinase family protein [Neobacillus sp. DY30]|uniref:recombinase family protein n=1 Tax=Neobacillus sp. DY30 TaxID=3047871 RepID=UPI0024C03A89|nr:recombinase family protein [Neobacillus sp. DY30]WHY01361.1 recombinase family protein [Neobacillus sp. DY30]